MGVKVCGIRDAAAFDAAVGAGANWVGFVFFPPSPRAVTPGEAAQISRRREGGPGRVGLFVSPSDADVAAVLDAIPLDALQLYGTAERAAELHARFGLPVWRAVGVAARAGLPGREAGIDRVVVEAKAPPGATRPGGNAVPLDWPLLAGWTAPVPWLLAGGLTPDNVTRAIRASGAEAVDVSSGVERAPGRKDPALIRAFVHAAKSARRAAQTGEERAEQGG
ncbi:MAG: phosphoribosylanthranilate isomerase [Alphaproteobacteria bacterium]|nr:phosphoribosylanthranilate isomerase [Alphaproteobacteria bacterium]